MTRLTFSEKRRKLLQQIKLFSLFLLLTYEIHAQVKKMPALIHTVSIPDTAHIKEVIVTGYGTGRNLYDTPASIAHLTPADLQRYSNTSLLPVLNAVPGITMEERSPASYRISIRGSSIRSPYGIRNIKVYMDGIPFTDAAGNTNLNLLDFHSIGAIEIIKGPTGSMYGAGSGGTLLVSSKLPQEQGKHAGVEFAAGSYGLRSMDLHLGSAGADQQTEVAYSELRATGYRIHSAMERKMLRLSTRRSLNEKESLLITGFYSDLNYQTPGALTLSEYIKDPRQSRPATTLGPSAIVQKAAIYRKELFTGLSHTYEWNTYWKTSTSAYVSADLFQNPYINNYERENQAGYGARTVTRLNSKIGSIPFRLQFGGEYQYGYASDRNYTNKKGQPDSITSDNELRNIQLTGFSQVEADLPLQFIVNAGLSYNHISYHVVNLSAKPAVLLGHPYRSVLVPRIALLKKINPGQSVYISVSAGYSPPAGSEVLETTGKFNTNLRAENALTYEAGYKGTVWKNRFTYELTLFDTQVRNTIVQRQNLKGQTYFINEGSTIEKGAEFRWDLFLIRSPASLLSSLKLWNSLAISNFYFKKLVSGTANVSGNPLTGTAPYVSSLGLDAQTGHTFSLNLTARYSDRIPLNDQNTQKAASWIVAGGRINYTIKTLAGIHTDVYIGIENAFNRRYSLGNDLNAFGSRYFNAAPGRNYYLGLIISY